MYLFVSLQEIHTTIKKEMKETDQKREEDYIRLGISIVYVFNPCVVNHSPCLPFRGIFRPKQSIEFSILLVKISCKIIMSCPKSDKPCENSYF